MSNELINEKLDSVGRCLARIEEKKPPGVEQLRKDLDIQDILVVNLERTVCSPPR